MTNEINHMQRTNLPLRRPILPQQKIETIVVPLENNIDKKIEGYKNDFATGKITAEDFVNKMKEIGITVTMSEDGTTATFKYNGKEYSITNINSGAKTEEETHQVRRDIDNGSYFIETINSKGQQIKYEWYDPNGELMQWCNFEYDENGNNIRQTVYNKDSNWYVNEFDENGKNTLSYGGSTHNVIDYTTYYNYYENGQLKSTVTKDNNGDVIISEEYDEEGKIIGKTESWGNSISSFEYLEDGTKIETKRNKEGAVIVISIEYPNGNQKITCFDKGEVLETTEIVYNEDGSWTRTTVNREGTVIIYEIFDSKGQRIYKSENRNNVVTENVVAEADRLFYRLEQGDLSALDEFEKLGANIVKVDEERTLLEVSFEGKTMLVSTSMTPESHKVLNKLSSITSLYSLGVISLDELKVKLEETGAKVSVNDDNTWVNYSYEDENGHVWCSGSTLIDNSRAKDCKGADYVILKELGLTDDQIEQYFYREEFMETFGDGSPVKRYSYCLKENATVNGKPISSLSELVIELNKMTDEEALSFNEVCYRLEKGDLSALDDLKKLGIDVTTYEDSARIMYSFEYKNHEYFISVDKLDTDAGQFRNGLKDLMAKYQIGLISFEEYCEQLEKMGAEVERLTDENGNPEIRWKYNNGNVGFSKYTDNSNVRGASYDTLRSCGLTNSQIKKYFHREDIDKDRNSTYDMYILNDNVRINGRNIKTIKALIENLKHPKFESNRFIHDKSFANMPIVLERR